MWARLARVADKILIALAIGWCVMRFVGLGAVPVGLCTDELLAGLHVECLAQTGKSADEKPWPLFANGLGGGLYTPVYLYSLLGWTRVFGSSPVALRGMTAAFSVLTIVGLWLLARRLVDRRAAWLVAVAAALSPWSFQVARLSTDGPVAPAFLVWGVYLFLRSPRLPWAAAGGVVLALAAYTYPPLRVQVPLLTLFLLLVMRRGLRAPRVAVFLGSMALTGVPLVLRLLDGTLMGRSSALSIFTPDYVQANRGRLGPVTFMVKQLLENMFEHLRPSYLFFTGDPNIRHSTQVMGELGWLDIAALACFVTVVAGVIVAAFRPRVVRAAPPSQRWLVAAAAVAAGAFGTLPAAMCWEGLPHAVRSMGAWPAVALFSGVSLSIIWSRSPLVPVAALLLALAQTAHFFPYYFRVYPKESYAAWNSELREAADTRDLAQFSRAARQYPDLEFRYYLLRNFGETCVSSREVARRIMK
jgi:hypothetical protein